MARLSLAKLERHLYGAADILRREGMDAATYKDYIFGLLFLKRCSDVFAAEREAVVKRKTDQGMSVQQAEGTYGENPDFYNSFFVPERARWSHLQEHLNDSAEPYGAVLDKALGGLSESNESLQHVLDHISFMRTQGNKRVVSDEACRELVRHFGRYRLRNEDFQFSDLLGSAYEYLINMFAESAGKKGGDFYTPRDVIRLMVRMLDPKPGMSVYDPTCGSGGMLIITREYVEQSGGDATNLRMCGQVIDPSAWSICRLNMLLHGIRGADIQLQDTLLHPMHREAGELERFDRVIANPPFSQNYSRGDAMEFKERFRWGWCPTSGKKGDLMFAQHMLAVCKDRGMVCTVMPHGVLFRGGAEKEIRTKFLKEDLIEAVISLPPNLFYGAGIPACLLVMRPNLLTRFPNPNKPAERQSHVLFINADAEYFDGRAQNYLLPEHIEKIASTFERYQDIPGYARRVSLDEIADGANDFNLNVRRYVDNSPPPEPHDVRAHLVGGVPVAEIAVNQGLFDAIGFDPSRAFVPRQEEAGALPPHPRRGVNDSPDPSSLFDGPVYRSVKRPAVAESATSNGMGLGRVVDPSQRGTGGSAPTGYVDFAPELTERTAIAPLIAEDDGVKARRAALGETLTTWWYEHAARVAELPGGGRDLNAARADLLTSFTQALLPLGALDRFKLAGVVATWWTDALPDFKTLIENGFAGVVDGWVDAIADAVEDDAFVEACAFTASRSVLRATLLAFDRRFSDDKGKSTDLTRLTAGEGVYCSSKSRIHELPQTKLLYSLPGTIQSLLRSPDVFEPCVGTAREGMRTFDDFRFLRLRWETPPIHVGQHSAWRPLSKGGEHAVYYSDIHLLVKWNENGSELAEMNRLVNGQVAQSRQASGWWYRSGATYSKRSVKGFSVRALPAGCVFGTKGPAVLCTSGLPSACLIGWLNSRLIRSLVHLQANAFEFNTGIVKRLPWRNDARIYGLEDLTMAAILACRTASALDETNSCFTGPLKGDTLATGHHCSEAVVDHGNTSRNACCLLWDSVVDAVYGVDSSVVRLDCSDDDSLGDAEDDDSDSLSLSAANYTSDLLSYAIGTAIGRWDIRFTVGSRKAPELPDPFSVLPSCSPGMLQGPDGLPAKPDDVPADYPVEIDWDGILADDSEHSDDIVRRIRDVLTVIWKGRADAIEREACEILGVRELRDYFRKPGNGGFWMDHVKRYSKSRRKAPIYWYLRSAKGNYGLWLYYHRLDKDTYFKCLVNYVEPKLRMEDDRLQTLRTRKTAVGSAGREAKQLEKDIDRQQQFVAELYDFRDKLRRVADLHLVPDLNDGVILNIAPLHELVPWKEAEKAWEALQDAKYDWAHIAYQLWPDRVRDLCKRDLSVAIAHGLEDICEVEPPKNLRAATPDDDETEDGDEDDQE